MSKHAWIAAAAALLAGYTGATTIPDGCYRSINGGPLALKMETKNNRAVVDVADRHGKIQIEGNVMIVDNVIAITGRDNGITLRVYGNGDVLGVYTADADAIAVRTGCHSAFGGFKK